MKERVANALYEAERKGVKQIKWWMNDGEGGHCAMGAIEAALGSQEDLNEVRAVQPCPLCGVTEQQSQARYPLDREGRLIVHFNNDHGLTFGEIARKLGPDGA